MVLTWKSELGYSITTIFSDKATQHPFGSSQLVSVEGCFCRTRIRARMKTDDWANYHISLTGIKAIWG